MDDDKVVRFPDGEPLKGWRPAITPALQRRRKPTRIRWWKLALFVTIGGALGYAAVRDLVWRWTGL